MPHDFQLVGQFQPVEGRLHRARQTLQSQQGPTLYWLGAGGLDPDAEHPGEACHLVLDEDDQWQSKRLSSIQENARRLTSLYDTAKNIEARYARPACIQLSACDCSGFICWVMGIAAVQNGHRVTTSVMMDDANKGAGAKWFRYLSKPELGCLWIYPRGHGAEVGHVAIVSQLAADGRVAQFIDCSGDSFRTTGNAIAERYSDVFENHGGRFLTLR